MASELIQHATNPPCSNLSIFIPALNEPEWIICLKNDTDSLTVDDVLQGIESSLARAVNEEYWHKTQEENQNRISDAYWKRVKSHPALSEGSVTGEPAREGLKRVDYLSSYFLFEGLSIDFGPDGTERVRMDVSSGRLDVA